MEKDGFDYSEILKKLENISDPEVYDPNSIVSIDSLNNGSSSHPDDFLPKAKINLRGGEIASFFAEFNMRYQTNITSIPELFVEVDELKRKVASAEYSANNYDKKISELKVKISKYKAGFKAQTTQLQELENDNQILKSKLNKIHMNSDTYLQEKQVYESKISSLEQSLTTAQILIKNLRDELVMQRSNNELVNPAFISLQEMVEQSNMEISVLTQQRDILCNIVEKQQSAITRFTEIAPKDPVIVEKEVIRKEPDWHETLTTICNTSIPLLVPKLSNSVNRIRNNTAIPPKQRVIEVIKFISQQPTQVDPDSSSYKRKLAFEESKNQRLLDLLHEEVMFIMQLLHVKDFRSIVFPNHDQPLPTDFREKLTQHCSQIGLFLERTVPKPIIDNTFNYIGDNTDTDVVHIFDLLKPKEIVSQIEKVMNNMETELENNPELFYLYLSQLVATAIIQNYASEMCIRNQKLSGENTDLKGISDQLNQAYKQLGDLKSRETKMRQILDGTFESKPETDLLTLLESVMKYFLAQNREVESSNKLREKINNLKKEYSNKIFDLNNQYKDHLEVLQSKAEKSELELIEKNQYLTSENKRLTESYSRITLENSDLKKQVDLLLVQTEKTEKYAEDTNIKYADEKSSLISQIEELSSTLRNTESKYTEAYKQSRSLKNEVQSLQYKVKELESFKDTASNLMKQKSKELREEYEEPLKEIQSRLKQTEESFATIQVQLDKTKSENYMMKQKIEQQQMEVDSMKVQKKALEDKVKIQEKSLKNALEKNAYDIKAPTIQLMRRIENIFDHTFKLDDEKSIIESLYKAENLIVNSKDYSTLSAIKQIIGVGDNEGILNEIADLAAHKEDMEDKIQILRDQIQEISRRNNNKQYPKELEVWHSWAKRIYTLKGGKQADKLASDELRRMIEEDTISSITHISSSGEERQIKHHSRSKQHYRSTGSTSSKKSLSSVVSSSSPIIPVYV